MTRANEQGCPEPPAAGGEAATLLGGLERQRATLAWKCADLDAAGLRASVGVSSVTLGGLLKHLAGNQGRVTGQLRPAPPDALMHA